MDGEAIKKVIEYLQDSGRKRTLIIDELGGLEIRYTPVSVREMEKILSVSQGGSSSTAYHLAVITEKALDADGKKLFREEDKPILESLDFSIITRISNAIAKSYTVKDGKKKAEEGSIPEVPAIDS
jgi:hypothetical protein